MTKTISDPKRENVDLWDPSPTEPGPLYVRNREHFSVVQHYNNGDVVWSATHVFERGPSFPLCDCAECSALPARAGLPPKDDPNYFAELIKAVEIAKLAGEHVWD